MFAVRVGGQKGAGEGAGRREGEPISTVGQELLHGSRVQFNAGKLEAVMPGRTLEMRPFEAVRTIFSHSPLRQRAMISCSRDRLKNKV